MKFIMHSKYFMLPSLLEYNFLILNNHLIYNKICSNGTDREL